jgi:hypothetical protein
VRTLLKGWLFVSVFGAVPASTQAFGERYEAADRAVRLRECTGGGCTFCEKEQTLLKHDTFNHFCPSDREWRRLKEGDAILVSGRSSIAGVRILSFQPLDAARR